MILDPGLRLWGSERALAASLLMLTEAWDRVVLVTPPGAELADEVRSHPDRYGPVEIVYAPIGMLHQQGSAARIRAMAALGALALRVRPGRVYLNQAGLVRLVGPVCRALGLPLVVHVRILEDVARVIGLRGSPRRPVDLVFISEAMRAEACAMPLSAGTAWHMVYDPYLLDRPGRGASRAAAFAFVGRLSHGKGVHLILEALARPELAEADIDIYGVGVDGDDYADRLAAQAYKLGKRVRMMGFHRDVRSRLPGYRYLVLTSRYEPLGRVVMEGWEAGLVPVVYAGCGGAAEMVVKAGGGGLIYDAWTADSLASALAQALELSEDARRDCAAAGRAWMARELSLNRYRSALARVLF